MSSTNMPYSPLASLDPLNFSFRFEKCASLSPSGFLGTLAAPSSEALSRRPSSSSTSSMMREAAGPR